MPVAYFRTCIVYLYILDSVVATGSREVYIVVRCFPLGDKPGRSGIGAVYKRAVCGAYRPATRCTLQVVDVLASILVVVAVVVDKATETYTL